MQMYLGWYIVSLQLRSVLWCCELARGIFPGSSAANVGKYQRHHFSNPIFGTKSALEMSEDEWTTTSKRTEIFEVDLQHLQGNDLIVYWSIDNFWILEHFLEYLSTTYHAVVLQVLLHTFWLRNTKKGLRKYVPSEYREHYSKAWMVDYRSSKVLRNHRQVLWWDFGFFSKFGIALLTL